MRLTATILTALLLSAGPTAARDPLTGTIESFFGGYRPAPPPVGGDCRELAAAIGPEATWFGTFSGKRRLANERFQAFGAQACFDREADCRVWQQRAINYADGQSGSPAAAAAPRGDISARRLQSALGWERGTASGSGGMALR
jgi:hypothetical protein